MQLHHVFMIFFLSYSLWARQNFIIHCKTCKYQAYILSDRVVNCDKNPTFCKISWVFLIIHIQNKFDLFDWLIFPSTTLVVDGGILSDCYGTYENMHLGHEDGFSSRLLVILHIPCHWNSEEWLQFEQFSVEISLVPYYRYNQKGSVHFWISCFFDRKCIKCNMCPVIKHFDSISIWSQVPQKWNQDNNASAKTKFEWFLSKLQHSHHFDTAVLRYFSDTTCISTHEQMSILPTSSVILTSHLNLLETGNNTILMCCA